jgi:hypothetical protein
MLVPLLSSIVKYRLILVCVQMFGPKNPVLTPNPLQVKIIIGVKTCMNVMAMGTPLYIDLWCS